MSDVASESFDWKEIQRTAAAHRKQASRALDGFRGAASALSGHAERLGPADPDLEWIGEAERICGEARYFLHRMRNWAR